MTCTRYDSVPCNFNFEIKVICPRLQLFVQQIDILGFQSVRDRVSVRMRMRVSVRMNDSVVIGRKDDKEKLMNMLMCESENESGNTNNDKVRCDCYFR